MLQPIHLSLNANLASVQRMLGRLLGENIAIATDLAADLWDVFADPGQIDQIILNLAVNARDAMEQGGTLTVRTANMEVKEEQAAAAGITPGKYARVSISDTGHGMDAETQRHIFEPFFTTKEVGRGTGLGLSTVYGIVKQSGGHILVESEPGKGSTFSILMPASSGRTSAPAPAPAAVSTKPPSGETILVVEDDDTVRDLVSTMLRSAGYRVIAPPAPAPAPAAVSTK